MKQIILNTARLNLDGNIYESTKKEFSELIEKTGDLIKKIRDESEF
jgi:hypothetical protein